MKKLKLVSLILLLTMFLSNMNIILASDNSYNYSDNLIYDESQDDIEVSVIVELEQKPILDYEQAKKMGAKKFLPTNDAKNIWNEIIKNQENIKQEIINTVDENVSFKGSYTKTINGFAATVKKSDIEKIENILGVKRVYFDVIYDIPEVKISSDELDPKMTTSKEIINLPIDLSDFPYKGEKTLVAIVDSGVDVNHELMQLSDVDNVKMVQEDLEDVIYQLNAFEYAKDAGFELSTSDLYKRPKFPFCFDYADVDTDAFARRSDHGVHVAGIVGANGTAAKAKNPDLNVKVLFDGVAREAQILGMKVFFDKRDGAAVSNTIAAIEDAIALGADAVNLSLGSTAGFTYQNQFDGYEEIFKKAREAGVIVAAAAGNEDRMALGEKEGYNLPYACNPDTASINSPGTKLNAITVASIENAIVCKKYILDSEDNKIIYNDKTNFIEKFDNQNIEYVPCGIGLIEDFNDNDVEGKIALIERGDITFSEKVLNAEKNGAIGVVVYNSYSGGDELTGMKLEGVNIPAIFIGNTDGERLKNASVKVLDISTKYEDFFDNRTAYEMSDFSSWGCSPDLKLKPEITAPGGNIYSTITNNRYESISGTSMACPHITGASALMQQYVNETGRFGTLTYTEKVQAIEALMMSTAKVVKNKDNREYSPRIQGAGLIDMQASTNSEAYLINENSGKAKIELGEIKSNEFEMKFNIVNFGSNTLSYEINAAMFTDKVEKDGEYSLLINDISYFSDSSVIYNDKNININNTAISSTSSAITTSGAISTTGSAIVTVNPGEEKNITISVKLDESEINDFYNDFENGFFIEGFIYLNPTEQSDRKEKLSIPYMGFYNDWSMPPIVDGFYGYDDDAEVFYGSGAYIYSLAYEDDGSISGHYKIGKSFDKEIYNWDWIAVSPNGDNYQETVGAKVNFLRNAKYAFVYVLDDNKNIIKKISTSGDESYKRKSYYYNGEPTSSMLNNWDCRDSSNEIVPDGQYFYRIRTTIDYPGAKFQTVDIPVVVDTQKPSIISVDVDSSNIKLTTKDNHYIEYAAMIDTETNKIIDRIALTESKSENVFKFKKSLIKGNQKVKFVVSDFAGNASKYIAEITNNDESYETGNTGGSVGSVSQNQCNEIIDGNFTVTPDYINIILNNTDSKIEISDKIIDIIDKSKFDEITINTEVDSECKNISLEVSKNIIDLVVKNSAKININIKNIAMFEVTPTEVGNLVLQICESEHINHNENYTDTKYNFDLDITIDGKSIENSDKNIKVQIPINNSYDIEKLGVYTLDADNNFEYVMTYSNDCYVEFYPKHFSQYSIMIFEKTFEDIQSHWAKDSIESMASRHIVRGKTENQFAPDDIITRAEFIAMVVRTLDFRGDDISISNNLEGEKWYTEYISLANSLKLIDGTTYNAEGIISRIEMAKIISRAHAILNGKEVKYIGNLEFSDVLKSNDDYKYVGYAKENGLINGYPDETFRPVEDTTRAEAMKVIYNLICR